MVIKMFIQSETTPDPLVLRFVPGRPVLGTGTAEFRTVDETSRSPLARRLFEIDGVTAVRLEEDAVVVAKRPDKEWYVMKPAVLGAIMEQLTSGTPILLDGDAAVANGGRTDEAVIAEIRDLLATRIAPVVAQEGGTLAFHSFKNGIVYLDADGPVRTLMAGVANMLRHYVPEVTGVEDSRDARPKPGLTTPDGKAIQLLLEEKVNPAVASHGGHISLIDVLDDTAYIRLEGGCQGCGMADVTLKQGVIKEILQIAPTIKHVFDVTDHAGGQNPYYQARGAS